MAVDFGNSANWLMIYDQVSTAQGVEGNPLAYRPILPILLSQAYSYPFLRVAANYEQARSWWRLGAWVEFLVDENIPDVEVARILAPVNKAAIIPKPVFLDSYRIQFTIPYYFEEISLQVEGYTGELPETIGTGGGELFLVTL